MAYALDERAAAARSDDVMKVAIVGSGVSGLSAAYALREEHEVRLFEGESAVGGHVKTVTVVQTPDGRCRSTRASSSSTSAPTRRSSGCSSELGVETQPTDMSLGSACRSCRPRVQLAGARWLVRPADRASPGRRTGGLFRTSCGSTARPASGSAVPPTPRRRWGTFSTRGTSAPRSATISSSRSRRPSGRRRSTRILEFPLDYLLRFLDHHGLIGAGGRAAMADDHAAARRPTWSASWTLFGRLTPCGAGDPVVDIHRGPSAVTRPDGARDGPNISMRWSWPLTPTMRSDCCRTPTCENAPALGGFEYSTNQVVLHTDARLLAAPPSRRGRHGTSIRPTAGRPTDAGHDDLPHEPIAASAGPRRLLRLGQPG